MRLLACIESGRRTRVRLYRVDDTGAQLVAILVSVPDDAHEAIATLFELFDCAGRVITGK
jgi:hypothetical protein